MTAQSTGRYVWARPRRLLGTNAKTIKSAKTGALVASHQMSPATESVAHGGVNMCAEASAGCAGACLKNAGMNVMPTHMLARINKTVWWVREPERYHIQLNKEVQAHRRKAERLGLEAWVRPNTLSDQPRMAIQAATDNPDVGFYDYTKRLKWWAKHRDKMPDNYFVVLSRSESNHERWLSMMRTGEWVGAVVFDGPMPDTYLGFPVVDGTKDDSVWLSPPGTVRGLQLIGTNKAKQAARESGFAVNTGAQA
jgi:hypothetical protein